MKNFQQWLENNTKETAHWKMIIDLVDRDDKNNPLVLYVLYKNGDVLHETDSPPTKRGNKELEREYNITIKSEIEKVYAKMGDIK